MRKLVGALAVVVSLLTVLPSASKAAGFTPHMYGVELQLGGGYHSLADLNAYTPDASFAGVTPELQVNVGAQFGVGILYRQMYGFGWQFGYSRFISAMDSKYRVAVNRGQVSWAEQTVSGSELYALATWYWPSFWQQKWWWPFKEVSFGVGPAFYGATLDRSIDIAQVGGSHLTSGSFSDATGRSLGFLGTLGVEIPLKEYVGLSIQVGGRLAQVGKLTYKDASDRDVTVLLNTASNTALPVDWSGAFVKVSLRGYFEPASDWRNPGR